jgi:hypothetical protein
MTVLSPHERRTRFAIAEVRGATVPEQRANAQLIAAAPELLVALRGLLAHLESWKTIEVEGGWIAIARETIAKAEGHPIR